jgi:1-acyl-sn-glycerol-3-phosphate acyltransferase
VLYWWSKYLLLGPLMRLLARPTIEGSSTSRARRRDPGRATTSLVADSFLVPLLVPRRITFLAKREYFIQTGLIGWIKKVFFTGVGQVPVDRAVGRRRRPRWTPPSGCCARQAAGHLPRGHPVAGRAAVQGQDRCGPDGAGGRRAGDPGRG